MLDVVRGVRVREVAREWRKRAEECKGKKFFVLCEEKNSTQSQMRFIRRVVPSLIGGEEKKKTKKKARLSSQPGSDLDFFDFM